MINNDDFKNAIGNPDKNFENSVQQALNEIMLSEKRKSTSRTSPIRYILPAAAIIATAACAVFMLMQPDGQPDIIYTGNGIMSQSSANPAVAAEPTPPPDEAYEDTETLMELPEQPAITPIPTPHPIALDILPEEHWMLTDTLNIDINSLYEGYTYSDTASDQQGNKFWMVSNINQKLLACAISYGDIIMADIESGEFKAPTLYVYMLEFADDPERLGAIMAGAAPWLAELYKNSNAMVKESGQDMQLNTLQITFDENDEPKFCEMYFGPNCEIYISWVREDDTGAFSLMKLYSHPDLVSDVAETESPSDPDASEVVFVDSELEAAVRKKLNWQGALTPEKLAELTELQIVDTPIESLSGLEYCTGLDWLELSGCGIDDDDLEHIGLLPSLFTLGLGNNNITDITALKGLDLGWLYLSGNSISDLRPVSGMTNLYELYLDENPLSEDGALVPLTDLAGMRRLYLNGCGITDISPLVELYANAPMLEALFLYNNPIEDYSPLKDLDIPEMYWGN